MKKVMSYVRGIRGATAVENDEEKEIYRATRELLEEMVEQNDVDIKSITTVLFSSTPDLKSAFPAKAARKMGWDNVPLFCHAEIAVDGALPRCIRVLILFNTAMKQDQVKHVYQKGTASLKND